MIRNINAVHIYNIGGWTNNTNIRVDQFTLECGETRQAVDSQQCRTILSPILIRISSNSCTRVPSTAAFTGIPPISCCYAVSDLTTVYYLSSVLCQANQPTNRLIVKSPRTTAGASMCQPKQVNQT
ncbi:hypothetical protein GGR58DRAFT_243519 [Xylaria digitata]|nr:hypothetical protein GGR58DRAFT_243519 [Xylaria digitata]